jgi:hypothetical protein
MRRQLLFSLLFTIVSISTNSQNTALSFNGTSSYVQIADQNSIDLDATFTLEGWVYPTGGGSGGSSGGIILNKENSYEIARFADGTLQFALSPSGAGGDWAWNNTSAIAPLNTWSHYALVKSGTTVTFYLNGVQAYSNSSMPATLTANTQNLWLAGRPSLSQFFDGYLDEVRVWNTARTQADIRRHLFNQNLPNNATGLMAYYRMNEGVGTSAASASTNTTGLSGALFNSPAWLNSPVQHQLNAMSFDGIDDHVSIPSNPTLNITTAITLEAWVYATKNAGIQNVVSKSSNSQNTGYIFPRTDDGWASATFYLHIGGFWRYLTAPYPSLNNWHHLAATFDGSTMHLYINGSLMNSLAASGAIASNSNPLTLGNQPGYPEFFGGAADEIRIWNVARTQAEIQNNQNKELDPALEPNLVSYYTFNQGIANGANTGLTTVFDQKGLNNGTLTNMAMSGTGSNFSGQNFGLTTLPLRWLSFTAREEQNRVLLHWTTTAEENTIDFTVQHSTDNRQWISIGKLPAQGSATVNTYSFLHAQPAAGKNYYRILQSDQDGAFTYSDIRMINHAGQVKAFTLLANPVTNGRLRFVVHTPNEIRLIDLNGRVLRSNQFIGGIGEMNVQSLPAGVYLLQAGGGTQQVILQ